MGRGRTADCRCGKCKYPVAYGVPYGMYVKIEPDAGNGTTFRNVMGNGSGLGNQFVHALANSDSAITDARYISTRGPNTTLDCLMLGHVYSVSGDVADFYLPTIGSATDLAVRDYLDSGGIVWINTHQCNTSGTPNLSDVNAYLADLGSSVVLKTRATFQTENLAGLDVDYYRPIIPANSLWSVNPSTWLTSGTSLATRVVSLWDTRMEYDARRQLGPTRTGLTTPAVNSGNYTDLTAGEGVINYTLQSMPTGDFVSSNFAYMTADASAYVSAYNYCKVGFPSSTYFSAATHFSTSLGGGQWMFSPKTAGQYSVELNNGSFLRPTITAETLTGGGRLIVSMAAPNSGYSYIDHLLSNKLRPSCSILSYGLSELLTA